MFETCEQLDPLHRVEAEIQFEIRVRRNDRARLGRGPDDFQRVSCIRVNRPLRIVPDHGGGLFRIRSLGGSFAVQPLDLMPLQLARRGTRQRIAPDVEAQHPLVAGQLERQPLDVEADDLAHVHDAAFTHHVEIRHHDRVQPLRRGIVGPRDTEHAQLGDEGRLAVDRFHFFRIDVLPRREHDDLLLPPRDVEAPARIEVPEVTGVEPAVPQGRSRSVRPVVIAGHHDRPLDQDLAVCMIARPIGGIVEDADVHAGHRLADRLEVRIAGPHQGRGARTLGQPVRLDDVEAHAVEVASDARIEAGPAGYHDAHAAAQRGMNRSKEQPARIHAERAPQSAVQREHRSEQYPERPGPAGEPLEHPLMQQVEELRHHAERGDLPRLQGAHHLGAVQRGQEHHACATGERQEQVGNLGQGVEERQHPQDAIVRRDPHDPERRIPLGQEVPVRQHDAFGIARRPRRVQEDGRIRRRGRAGWQVRISSRFVQSRQARRRSGHQDDPRGGREIREGCERGGQVDGGREEHPRARIRENGLHLRGLVGGIERNRRGADLQDAEIRAAPARVVVRENGAAIPRRAPVREQEAGRAIRDPPHVAVGIGVRHHRPEDFDRGMLGEPPRGRQKQFDNVVHRRRRAS